MKNMYEQNVWKGCYRFGWQNHLVPEAFSHPAKVSFTLAGKIYDHAIKMGWIKKGDTVLDPFGGICGFGFHALVNGINWVGVELEEKFVKLGQQNIDLWNRKFRDWPNLGTARIIRGDSRRIKEREGEFSMICSSPPFEKSLTTKAEGTYGLTEKGILPNGTKRGGSIITGDYGNSKGQLGNTSNDTFWEASKEIVQGCHELLKPSGMAIFVCKDYIKTGKRVPFSQRWASLCESVGFKIVCWHHAMLVENYGFRLTLDGQEEEIQTSRKSFFRRLAEKNGSPRIDHEDVICMRKAIS